MIYLASLTEKTSDKILGYNIIKTKEELDRVIIDNTRANKVIIRRDFAAEYFTPSGIIKFVEDVKYINPSITIELDEKSDVITSDQFIKILSNIRNFEELLMIASRYPKETLDSIKLLTSSFVERKEELLNASTTVSRLQHIIDEQKQNIGDLKYALKIEQENKALNAAKLDSLVKRINYQYNVAVDKNYLFNVNSNNYDKVVYIKEITRVQFTDSLIYYLKEILKVLYSMPTRLVVIESFYALGKVELYSNNVPHFKLKEKDVISGDILMLGMQPTLMRDILRNPSNISILIVLDRGGYSVPHIIGDNVEYLYTSSDLKDVPDDIPKSRIISYSEETLYIPYIKEFNKLDGCERISKYSSMDIMKKLVALIEGR